MVKNVCEYLIHHLILPYNCIEVIKIGNFSSVSLTAELKARTSNLQTWDLLLTTISTNYKIALQSYFVIGCTDWQMVQLQVNNFEIVVNFFHISYNMTWYSEIVRKFTQYLPSFFNLWTDKTIHVNL